MKLITRAALALWPSSCSPASPWPSRAAPTTELPDEVQKQAVERAQAATAKYTGIGAGIGMGLAIVGAGIGIGLVGSLGPGGHRPPAGAGRHDPRHDDSARGPRRRGRADRRRVLSGAGPDRVTAERVAA